MISDYIDIHSKNMIKDLSELVAIPSVADEDDTNYPCGKEVTNALNYVVEKAKSMGLEAKNLGLCAEIKFGGIGDNPEKVYIATHTDVVPAGDGWDSDPFELAIKEGKLYGRGTHDDKGPTISVLYAMKAIKDLGFTPKSEIILLVGGCEETSMNDMKWYVEKFGQPDYGLTPDSEFPITNGEAGLAFGKILIKNCTNNKRLILNEFYAGTVYNAVPDSAHASLFAADDFKVTAEKKLISMADNRNDFEFSFSGNTLSIAAFGLSAHGSRPETGDNAAYKLISIIKTLYDTAAEDNDFIEFGIKRLVGDTRGEKMGVACSDTQSGFLTYNVGMVEYDARKSEGFYSFDIRIPVTIDVNVIIDKLKNTAKEESVKIDINKAEESFFIDPNTEFLKKLGACYEKITGKHAEYLVQKGGTYSKAFAGKCVAFGPTDKDNPSDGGNIHGPNEFIDIKAFTDLAVIYANVIKDLWC